MGYRFVLSNFSYPTSTKPDEPFKISFDVTNTGSSPFYYDWPVEISLLNSQTKEVVWSKTLKTPKTVSYTHLSAYIEIEPIKNLKLRSDNGGELVFYKVNTYEDGRMGQHYTAGGHANVMSNKKRYWQTENTATYSFDINKEHQLSAMAGFSASRTDYEEVTADSKKLSSILKLSLIHI